MNAPTTPPAKRRADGLESAGGESVVQGYIRHVSADGCQLILPNVAFNVGQRLDFSAVSGLSISGTIRWVLGDRAGFVFERHIGPERVAELTGEAAQLRTIRLLPDIQSR